MQQKDIKTILNYLILISIALIIIGISIPITYFDYSDVLEDYGVEDPEWYWTIENAILYQHRAEYTFNENSNQKPTEYHLFKIFHEFFEIEIGNSDAEPITDYTREEPTVISQTVTKLSSMILYLLAAMMSFYFYYKGIKLSLTEKNKYFLYLGILGIISIILFLSYTYYLLDFVDTQNLGYTNYIKLDHGFYIFLSAIILYFLIYIIQSKYLNLPEKKSFKITEK